MRRLFLVVVLAPLLVGCDGIRRLVDGPSSTQPLNHAPPADYTVTGTTLGDFDLIPVRVLDSNVTVRVNRATSPEAGWHDCDSFEIRMSTTGTGGGAVRLWYLNLTVGGVSVPVAPAGTQYEIHSVLRS